MNGGFCGIIAGNNSQQAWGVGAFKVTMRAAPTIVLYDGNGASGNVTQIGIGAGIAATAGYISAAGFSFIERSSGNFNTTSFGYPAIAGFTASIEL